MREIRPVVVDINRYLEDAARVKQQLDADAGVTLNARV
jgi:hypothetical protein